MKVNQAGVIPVIFASSLLQLPQLLAQVWNNQGVPGLSTRSTWSRGDHPLYLLTYFALIIFFTYFYVAITFNPVEVADNMKKYGGFIPGIRPGRPTPSTSSGCCPGSRCPGRCSWASSRCCRWRCSDLTKSQQFPFGGTAS